MPAVGKLLVDLLVARAAVSSSHLRADDEAVVFFLLLALRGLMAIQARHSLGGVLAHLIFMHDGILLPQMAFGAFPGSANERSAWLVHLAARPCMLDEKGAKNERERNDNGYKNATE